MVRAGPTGGRPAEGAAAAAAGPAGGLRLPGPVQGALDAAANAVRAGRDHAERALRELASRLPRPAGGRSAAPLTASLSAAVSGAGVSSSSSSRGPQPLYQLALAPAQIAPKLQHVPVWTITNTALEFITVAGKADAPRQLQLFFFNEADAKLLLAKVRAKDPNLGKSARVAEVGLDKVYSMMTGEESRRPGADEVAFRFVPDAREVLSALELARAKGAPMDSFPGVPVFQAVGLTMRNKSQRYLPLFLSKDDADNAVNVAKAKGTQLGTGTDAARVPSVEVGSLEAVLASMVDEAEASKPHWSEMVLIASSSAAAASAALGVGAEGTAALTEAALKAATSGRKK